MKSLVLLNENRINTNVASNSSKLCYDAINKITFLTCITESNDCEIYTIKDNKSELKTSFPIMSEDKLKIIDTIFLVDSETLLIFFSNGDIFSINIDSEDVENIGNIEPGILAIAWSPDEELFVVYTLDDKLIIMTKDFEVISEKQIQIDEEEQEKYVTVGWGKKETQFHGSAGKHAAKETINYSSFKLSEFDDQLPKLSWRGDGNYFVCSLIDKIENIRILKVYNREGVLQNGSELIDSLESNLDWKPSGSLIACTQRLPHRYQVVFFERNGLRHGEFILPKDVVNVKQIKWNPDSTILATLIEKKIGDNINIHIQLWFVNNYFWYLKYDLPLTNIQSNIDLFFDPEVPLNLIVNINSKYILNYNFDWQIFKSDNLSIQNALNVAVINGNQTFITPFRFRNVPPPMSSFQPSFLDSVKYTAFSNFNYGNQLTVLDIQHDLYVLKFEQITQKKITTPEVINVGNLNSASGSSSINYRQICYTSENEIYALGYCSVELKDYVSRFTISEKDSKITLVDKIECPSIVIKIIHQQGITLPLVQLNNGHIYQVKSSELEFILALSEKCTLFQAIEYNEYEDIKIVALSSRNKLYMNQTLIDNNCTSFAIHNEFLVYSTSNHIARFLPIQHNYNEIPANDLIHQLEPYSRQLERGSKIVAVAPHDVSLILQMPRGNLETVFPHALVLASVKESLQNKKYVDALIQCRKHRIDLNVLFDYNPDIFLNDIQIFVDQVENSDYLNLFISMLNDDNILNLKYSASKSTDTEAPAIYPNKVNIVCRAVREALLQKNIKKYVQSIVTTYARQKPADLEAILTLLKQLKEQDIDFAEKTLKYAIFLANVDQLYDVALGMYDFELVIMVAQQSQKDPKEYLPFLDELKKLEPQYRKFKIDKHLKRFDKALKNISTSGDQNFQECLDFIIEHSLYSDALALYDSNGEYYKKIMCAFAAYLHTKKKYQDAGSAYMTIQEYQKAIPSLLKVGNWQQALLCTKYSNYTKELTLEIIDELIAYLKNHSRHLEAFNLIQDYKKDPEEATACLLDGHLWTDSLYNCEVNNRKDLIETDVKPAMISNLEQIMEDLNEMLEQFNKQKVRVKELQTLPAPAIPEFDAPGLENVEIQSDATSAFNYTVYTQATTHITNQSTGSSKTGKSRRKLERKKNAGKKGSVFEYEYLLGSISRLVERVNNMQVDVKALLIALSSIALINQAKSLQGLLDNVINELNQHLDWIFQPAKPKSNLERLIALSKGQDGNPIQIVDKPTLKLDGKWKLEIL